MDEPGREKTWGLRPGKTQTSLFSYRDIINYWNVASTGKVITLYRKPSTKVLIRLHRCSGWAVPLLFACNKIRFSHDEAHIIYNRKKTLKKTTTVAGWWRKFNQESTLFIISMIYVSFQTTPPSSPSSLGSRKSSMCSISSITSSSSGSTQSHSPSHNKNLPQVRSHSRYYEQLLIYTLITHASCDFCRLLTTFANSLDPD